MRKQTLLVPVPYWHYSPHPVIIGLRRAVIGRGTTEQDALAMVAAECDGWQTLAVAHQERIRWSRQNGLRITAAVAGGMAGNVPADVWNDPDNQTQDTLD